MGRIDGRRERRPYGDPYARPSSLSHHHRTDVCAGADRRDLPDSGVDVVVEAVHRDHGADPVPRTPFDVDRVAWSPVRPFGDVVVEIAAVSCRRQLAAVSPLRPRRKCRHQPRGGLARPTRTSCVWVRVDSTLARPRFPDRSTGRRCAIDPSWSGGRASETS